MKVLKYNTVMSILNTPLRDCICNNVERGDSYKQPKSEGLSPKDSPKKQPTFGDATTVFPAKWRLWNMRSNSILMTRHYSDLGSASDWLKKIFLAARLMRIWVVTRHQYGISAIGPKMSFRRETSSDVMKGRLFSQDTQVNNLKQNGGSGVYQFSGSFL